MKLADALEELRRAIFEGLSEGEGLKKIAERVAQIFLDPMRAYRIARTEASRSVHSGQYLSAKQSGVVKGKKWLAKSDACEKCRELDGVEVGLDDYFANNASKNPTYAVVYYPPYHPHCTCGLGEVLKDQYGVAA